MRKKFAISSILLAILIVLVSGTIPHHHHENGVVCFSMTHCEDDNTKDDEHTDQNTHTCCHHNTSCIAEANYYINPENEVKVKAPSCDNCDNPGHIHLFPLLYLVPDFLIYPVHNTYTKPKQGEYILFYTSAEVSRFRGLRAPPFVLS